MYATVTENLSIFSSEHNERMHMRYTPACLANILIKDINRSSTSSNNCLKSEKATCPLTDENYHKLKK